MLLLVRRLAWLLYRCCRSLLTASTTHGVRPLHRRRIADTDEDSSIAAHVKVKDGRLKRLGRRTLPHRVVEALDLDEVSVRVSREPVTILYARLWAGAFSIAIPAYTGGQTSRRRPRSRGLQREESSRASATPQPPAVKPPSPSLGGPAPSAAEPVTPQPEPPPD